MGRLRMARAAVALSLLITGSVIAPGVVVARDPAPALPNGAADITNTPKGRQVVKEARGRYERQGHTAGELRAVRDGSGILIVPKQTKLIAYTTIRKHGRDLPVLAPLTADDPGPVPEEQAVEAVEAAAAMSWTLIGDHCYSQITDTWAVLDHCYKKYKLSNDGSGTYDWYALHRYGTARNNSPWVLDLARIRAYRSGGSSQTWSDWSPRGNWYGGSCSTVSIGISTPVGGLSQSFERCPEQVTFTKSANGSQPDYTQTWFGMGTRGNRELNFEISVRVRQGGSATFTLPAQVRGSPY